MQAQLRQRHSALHRSKTSHIALGNRLLQAETILLSPHATHQELEPRKDLVEAIDIVKADAGTPARSTSGARHNLGGFEFG